MSSDTPTLWRITAIAARELIQMAADAFEQALQPEPLAVSMFEDEGTSWRLDVLYEDQQDLGKFKTALTAFDETLASLDLQQSDVPHENWVLKSLEGLAPVQAGRFFVHGAHDSDKVPPGAIPLVVEAGEAFGTGHHGTTEGCLTALSQIAESETPASVLDLGTGTGVLAIGAAKLWRVPVIATDIDPIATKVARENVVLNGAHGQIQMVTAAGTNHAAIRGSAPYDLIIANILARPLRQMAGSIASVVAPRGIVVLSGILGEQALRVIAAYRGHHLSLETRLDFGEWVTLILRKV